ncbi:MAG: DUF362 domain-containing protein [Armatimonadetes bacterium]|nr:DUF362 domain-containing protein [Armatimonadota bacterium]
MDRRHFLRATASATLIAGASSLPLRVWGQTGNSRVVVVRNVDMATTTEDPAIKRMLAEMVHEGVRALVGGDVTREEAWRKFLKPGDVVGVKINGIAPPMTTHPAFADAIAEGASFCGITAGNVIVFDKEDRDLAMSGFTINRGGNDIQCYGTVGPPGSGFIGYEDRQTFRRDTAYHLSRIVSRQCTALINVPVIKDHSYAGLTCALKNHFGCIDNPNQFHKISSCSPAIVDVNRDPNILNKQRLIICDARAVQYNGGPSFKPQFLQPYYALLVSTDPVALDTIAMEIIEMCRRKNGMESLMMQKNPPRHIAEAAQNDLGTNDRARIDLVVRELGSGKI